MSITMTWDDWEKKYVPMLNTITDRTEFNGWLFETYDDDLKYILEYGNNKNYRNHIWTLLTDDNGDLCISNGYHLVNRMGYFITSHPYDAGDNIFVQDEDDVEKTFTIYSSHGELSVRVDDGEILNVDSTEDEDDYLPNIARIDIDEWEAQYPGEELKDSHHDILNFGYWNNDGSYDKPEQSWREDRKQNLIDQL